MNYSFYKVKEMLLGIYKKKLLEERKMSMSKGVKVLEVRSRMLSGEVLLLKDRKWSFLRDIVLKKNSKLIERKRLVEETKLLRKKTRLFEKGIK